MTTTILALDLGTTTGWMLRGSDGHITSGSESFRPQRFEGGGMRFCASLRWLTEIIPPTVSTACTSRKCVAMSRPTRPRLRRIPGHAHGVVRAPPDPVPGVCRRHDQETRDRQGRNASKDEMVGSVRRGHQPADDDEADALALLHWAIETQEV